MGLESITSALQRITSNPGTLRVEAEYTPEQTQKTSECFGWFDVVKPPLININGASRLIYIYLKTLFGDKAVVNLPVMARNAEGQEVIENAYRKVSLWLENNDNRGLLCYGSCGLGKTVLCGTIIPRIINEKLHKVVNCYHSSQINQCYKDIMSQKYVMIDDIGMEDKAKNYGENLGYVFGSIVDNAERKGNILILTSNLSLKEMKDKYGDRTIDRLKGLTTQILFSGESLRNK